jgi:hypothetical protein
MDLTDRLTLRVEPDLLLALLAAYAADPRHDAVSHGAGSRAVREAIHYYIEAHS